MTPSSGLKDLKDKGFLILDNFMRRNINFLSPTSTDKMKFKSGPVVAFDKGGKVLLSLLPCDWSLI